MKSRLDEVRARCFIAPDGSNRPAVEETFRALTADLLDQLCASERRPLLPESLRYEFTRDLIQEAPKSLEEIRASVRELIAHSMNPYHPRYIGHMDSMPTLLSVIGDMLASALNNNLFSVEMAPFLTHLEYRLAKELCTLFGLPETAGGMVLSGGSLANLQALTVARNHALGDNRGCLRRADRDLVILCSEHAHVSIQKSAMVMGMGLDGVIQVRADADGRMRVDDLRRKIAEARQGGLEPCAVVATAGTTVTGNIDPLEPIAEVARAEGIWLHADAIWGGGLIFSERKHDLLRGIESADSVTFNAQKWMTVAKTCSLVLFRDNDDLERYFRIRKTYVREHDIVTDLSETGITGTKRAEVLKLWLSIESLGRSGYAAYVDHTLDLAEHFAGCVRERPYLKLAAEPETAVICFRGEPPGLDPALYDDWNSGLQAFLLENRHAFFSLPTFRGGKWQRVILLNPFLTREGIDDVFTAIDAYARG